MVPENLLTTERQISFLTMSSSEIVRQLLSIPPRMELMTAAAKSKKGLPRASQIRFLMTR